MISVLTGDIIKSSKQNPEIWLHQLKGALEHVQPDRKLWEIYRGDSFQLELTKAARSFEAAVYIKACLKSIKGLDIRIAIGLGSKSFEGNSISESNGPAFRYSGETIEGLKKDKRNLGINSDFQDFDEQMNLFFNLVMIPMDNWTVNSAEIVKLVIENPSKNQTELAAILNTSQHAVSKRLKRAHFDEIMELNNYFMKQLKSLS